MKNCIPSNVDKRSKLYRDLEQYQEYLYRKNLSDNTVRSYLHAVRQYFKQHRKITAENLQLYRAKLIDHYSPQTVNISIRALNNYFKFLEIDLMSKTIKVTRRMQLDRVISQADYEYLKRRLKEDQIYNYYYAIRFMAATGDPANRATWLAGRGEKGPRQALFKQSGRSHEHVRGPQTIKSILRPVPDRSGADVSALVPALFCENIFGGMRGYHAAVQPFRS